MPVTFAASGHSNCHSFGQNAETASQVLHIPLKKVVCHYPLMPAAEKVWLAASCLRM